MLARDKPLPDDFDLPGLLGEFPPQPLDVEDRLVWLNTPRGVTESPTRTPDFSTTIVAENLALKKLKNIEDKLREQFSFVEAVSFAKTGE